jgi:diguanylate cyclase (GGDEF)-like protein
MNACAYRQAKRADIMIRGFLARSERATLIAYGGWAALACAICVMTQMALRQVERTETRAVLAWADRGAAALEQATLRVFESIRGLQALAQARQHLLAAGNTTGRAEIEQQMGAWVNSQHFGIDEVLVTDGQGGLKWTSSGPFAVWSPGRRQVQGLLPPRLATGPTAEPQVALNKGEASGGESSGDGSGLVIGKPARAPSGRWILRMTLPLANDPAVTGQTFLILALDAVALSNMLAAEMPVAAGETGAVRRLSDGAFLARTRNPGAAFSEQAAPDDPVLAAAVRDTSGQWHDTPGSGDRLVAFRVVSALPVLVSDSVNGRIAMADYYSLQRLSWIVAAGAVLGTFAATRLLLWNVLLRRRLSAQAMHDPLTGLNNRRYFTDVMPRMLQAAAADGATAAVLLIDLDGFKYVNDSRGHATGDTLLREVAQRLRACARQNDHVMRIGGDEFALVRIGRQQRRDTTSLARFIIAELSRIYEIDGYHVRIGASVGIAFPPEGGEQLPDLLRSADIALYAVKSDGGGGHRLFDPGMEETVRSRRALEMDLREALLRQELEVYYQPLIQLDPRRVSGFEALVRWHHPVHGMVMPGRFIPMAEETGLISGIGQWVLRQACMEATRWPAHVRIAVNISPVQFDRSDIVDIVGAALRESRLDPSRLELEITEGVVVLDTGEALNTMRRLQALGVRLALDDFGTGYSSLSYLRCFPFDKVKIDGSFLSDLGGDGGAIIRAVLSLCAHLELDTLVEGVETEEQLIWLRNEGCTEAQGHLFSQAQPADALQQVMHDVAGGGTPRPKVVNFFRKA